MTFLEYLKTVEPSKVPPGATVTTPDAIVRNASINQFGSAATDLLWDGYVKLNAAQFKFVEKPLGLFNYNIGYDLGDYASRIVGSYVPLEVAPKVAGIPLTGEAHRPGGMYEPQDEKANLARASELIELAGKGFSVNYPSWEELIARVLNNHKPSYLVGAEAGVWRPSFLRPAFDFATSKTAGNYVRYDASKPWRRADVTDFLNLVQSQTRAVKLKTCVITVDEYREYATDEYGDVLGTYDRPYPNREYPKSTRAVVQTVGLYAGSFRPCDFRR